MTAPVGGSFGRVPSHARPEPPRRRLHRSVLAAFVGAMAAALIPVGVGFPTGLEAATAIAAANMSIPRQGHTATLLPNGQVLVAGGQTGNERGIASAELYDPAAGTWRPTGSMTRGRFGHFAVLLKTGKVLVIGGTTDPTIEPVDPTAYTAELYDPTAGTWSPTGGLRGDHFAGATATLLANGQVLVAGGDEGDPRSADSVIYDPGTGKWRDGGQMRPLRSGHSATLLSDGRVLVAGGHAMPQGSGPATAVASTAIYNPRAGTWTTSAPMAVARDGHVAVRLADGRVLVAGGAATGSGIGSEPTPLRSAELFDPKSGKWSPGGDLLTPRSNAEAVLLGDGRVLVVGGVDALGSDVPQVSELFDPGTGAWTTGPTMPFRMGDTVTVLADGLRVLVAGGLDADPGDPTGSAGVWSFSDSSPSQSAGPTAPTLDWKHNPATGHYYALLQNGPWTWATAEVYAVHLGGHLATINDAAEDRWVIETFQVEVAVGLNDVEREGHWVWTSGEPVTYTNWAPGEPNDGDAAGGSEDIASVNTNNEPGLHRWIDGNVEVARELIEVPALPTTGWLTGRVTAGGEPLAGATVTAWRIDAGAAATTPAGTASTAAFGDYEIVGLLPGEYRVAFDGGTRFAIEYWPSRPLPVAADPITVAVGTESDGVDADLEPPGRISGAVTTAGRPIPGIQVTADLPFRGTWVLVGRSLTGADGRFELTGLPAGQYRVSFEDPQQRYAAFVYDTATPDAPNLLSVGVGGTIELRLAVAEVAAPTPGGAGPPGSGGSGPGVFVGYLGYRNVDTLAPAITTIIPTPSDISFDPKVISANLFFASLAMILLTIATEFLNRSLGRLEPTLSSRVGPIRRLERARAALDAATVGRLERARRRRLAVGIRLAGIVTFYGVVFSLLDPTWDPLSVTGLWLVLIMAVAFGLVGLAGDISAWAMARRWGVASDLDLKTGSLLTAITSTVASRVLPLVPGVMIGSPEALDIDPDQVDQRRLGRIAAVGLGTILVLGLGAWLLTLAMTALRGSGQALDVALGGGEAFLLLVFAAAVQNGFVQLLALRDSAGLALRRAHPVAWVVALLVVTFAFWHTLVNPRGDLAQAVETTNVRAFLATVGVVLLLALVAWLGTTLAHYRAVAMPFASGVAHAEVAASPPGPTRSCRRCGSRGQPDARYCAGCGLDLAELATATA